MDDAEREAWVFPEDMLYELDDGSIYVGQTVGKMRHGKGKMFYSNGTMWHVCVNSN